MTRIISPLRYCVGLCTVLGLLSVYQSAAYAQSAVKLQNYESSLDVTNPGTLSLFSIAGEASHLGKFTGFGEVVLLPGEQPGSLTGSGPVVLVSANGDLLVGVVTWDIGAEQDENHTCNIHFSWRDSITFSDGTVARTTGHFVKNRPAGAAVTAKYCRTVCVVILETQLCRLVCRDEPFVR